MPKRFLTAQWRNLLMANFETDAAVLHNYIPHGTELDAWNGKHYVSVVGFMFQDTRVLGLSIPFHKNFEEVNLRFYVRYRHADGWRRGVVFVKEFVPKRMITMVANALYGEKYATLPMRHTWEDQDQQRMKVRYEWQSGEQWNHIEAIADKAAVLVSPDSKEHFITEHYWGYAQGQNGRQTFQYQVTHPSWRIHPIHEYSFHLDTAALYGHHFLDTLSQAPASVFLAEGSGIEVMQGIRI